MQLSFISIRFCFAIVVCITVVGSSVLNAQVAVDVNNQEGNIEQNRHDAIDESLQVRRSESLTIQVDSFQFVSKILGEDRQFWVHLPEGYESAVSEAKTYPVVYVLDGQRLTLPVSSIVDYYSQRGVHSQLPEVIVVGITSKDRGAELTPTHVALDQQPFPFQIKNSGKSVSFRKFLDEELIPYIDQHFRTAPYRVLVGHSLGGLFVVNESNLPESSFHAFIALDPSLWWDPDRVLKRLGESWKTLGNTRKLFIYRVTYPADDAHRKLETPTEEILAQFAKASDSLQSRVVTLEGLDHGSCVIPGTQRGLFDVFAMFPMDVRRISKDPDQLVEHYRRYSDAVGYQLQPPRETVEWFVQFNRRNGNVEIANQFLQLLSDD